MNKLLSLICGILLIVGCTTTTPKEVPVTPPSDDAATSIPEVVEKEVVTEVIRVGSEDIKGNKIFYYTVYDDIYGAVISLQRVELKDQEKPVFVLVLGMGRTDDFETPNAMWDDRNSEYNVGMIKMIDKDFPGDRKYLSGVGLKFINRFALQSASLPTNSMYVRYEGVGVYKYSLTPEQWRAALNVVLYKEGL